MTKYEDAMAYLQALGLVEKLDTFVGRKRIQKIIYLLKQFGADLKFGYGWYIHGPYSPELTRTLLDSDNASVVHERELTLNELKIMNNARNFLAGDFYSVESIELIVSLIYLIKHGSKEGLDTKEKIITYLHRQKPRFSDEEIEEGWNKIEKSGIWGNFFERLKE